MSITQLPVTEVSGLDTFFYGIYPYICFTVFVLGSILRMDRDPYSWRTKSSQLLRKGNFIWASYLFHIGIIMILLGHFVGLLTPHWLYADVLGLPVMVKQWMAMGFGGFFGLVCLVGLLMLLSRRLQDPRIRALTTFADIAILIVLLVQLLLGLTSIFYSAQHTDGSRMVELAEWAQHIVTFRPGAAAYVANAEWVFKTHIVLGMTIFLIFPFTRLVHMLSVPVGYLLRRNQQIVRKRARR
ncbi:respiratory nitrate reductase subunit gamma [Dongshaea marina]|uniref:respiratory nitrate reductase subunit gamma n=1 Tax=Dongshaea marina TaxID=2047966 RepID=UPI000D3E4F8F|nr:respiratory nitrate reductase subunit gamma [Dongshaea marina]